MRSGDDRGVPSRTCPCPCPCPCPTLLASPRSHPAIDFLRGARAKTSLRFDGRILEGVALLEGDSIVFRGGVSLTVKFSEISRSRRTRLARSADRPRPPPLRARSEGRDWAEKIKNPKALVEKLGVDAQKKVCVVGKLDADLRADLEASGAKIAKSARGKDFDMVFVAASSKKDLEKLASLREMIKDDGGIWIVYPKGKAPTSPSARC